VVKEYTIASRQAVDGVSVPISPVYVVNPNGDLLSPFNTWDSIPLAPNPTPPAAAASFAYTVPSGRRGVLYSFASYFVTSAVAGNRNGYFAIIRGGVYLYRSPSGSNETASQTDTYDYCAGLPTSDAADQDYRTWPFANAFELQAGDIIAWNIIGVQAGDQITPMWNYKEMPA